MIAARTIASGIMSILLVVALVLLLGMLISAKSPYAQAADQGDASGNGIGNNDLGITFGSCGGELADSGDYYVCTAKSYTPYCQIEPFDSTGFCINSNEASYGFSSTTMQGQINTLKRKMIDLAATIPGNIQPEYSLEFCGVPTVHNMYGGLSICGLFAKAPTTTKKINALAQQIRDIRNTHQNLVDLCLNSRLDTSGDQRCVALRYSQAHSTVNSTSVANTTTTSGTMSTSLADILNGISSHFTLPSDITNNGQTININIGDLVSTSNAALQQRIAVLVQLIQTLQRVLELRQQLDALQGTATSTTHSTATSTSHTFSVSPEAGSAPVTVTATFTSGVACSDAYDLSWGDGSANVTMAYAEPSADSACEAIARINTFSHTYSTPGTYTVTLKSGKQLDSVSTKKISVIANTAASSYTLSDIGSVTKEDMNPTPNVPDTGYTLYTIGLKDDTVYTVRVYGLMTSEMVNNAFYATGYSGSVSDLMALAS